MKRSPGRAEDPTPRSALGRIWRGARRIPVNPVAVFPWQAIKAGATEIRRLLTVMHRPSQPDKRLFLLPDRVIDLQATAFAFGMSVGNFELLLATRQRETARAAYLSFALGWMFFALWLWRLLTLAPSSSHLLTIIEFLPFCLTFFLIAFRNALQNYQIRNRSVATVVEFLRTPFGFWPS